ncbi:MAG: 16S rRNA (uracil(1498)-N(3))-methyltransferase [Desulfobacteraceae bacterium]|nr:MAG: 16S rRNA (uracil(1498)-N(3))-methyltransferase [Desulfobacteraceae bacterium]
MRRFFIDPSEISKGTPVIEGQDAYHIAGVLRLKPKDHIILVDGTGFEYKAEILSSSKNQVAVSIVEKYAALTESPIGIHVCQGYLKDKKMEMLIRHLTEIGITRWTPVISERSIPQADKKPNPSRIERWHVIAREAVKQCRRTRVPEITPLTPFQQAVTNSADMDLKIIFYENATVPFSRSIAPDGHPITQILVIFGPEGGFSNREIEFARSNGFLVASLGPRILKAETASIAACTLIQHIFGDMG